MSAEDIKNEILSRVQVHEIISERVKLESRSGVRVGLCPFHQEKTPSFTVYPDRFYCYGCKESGDVISFVRKTEGLGFIDALKFLAAKSGIDTTSLDQPQKSGVGPTTNSTQALKANTIAQEYFVQNLKKRPDVCEYLKSRGFSEEQIVEFGFGYAPKDGLIPHLKSQGISLSLAASIGLASQSAGRGYDFFRHRLTVPIHDSFGRIVAFGARALEDGDHPKYKNTKETSLFSKAKVLFGFDKAKQAIKQGHKAILVEGYMDVLTLWAQGFKGAVACMGTALRREHLELLKQVTSEIVLLFDGDQAGQKASLGTVKTAADVHGLKVKVARLPLGEDPDSFVRKCGSQALTTLMEESSEDLLTYVLQHSLKHSVNVAKTIEKDIKPWLESIEDPLQRNILSTKIAAITGVAVAFFHKQSQPKGATAQDPSSRIVLKSIEKEFLYCITKLNDNEKFPLEQFEPHFEAGVLSLLEDYYRFNRMPEWLEMELEQLDPSFANVNLDQALHKILGFCQRQKIQKDINHLKFELAKLDASEQDKVLAEIRDLNTKLSELRAPSAPIS